MKTIKDIYEPYNFSSSKCYVMELIISQAGATRIEAKLPPYMKQLTGIYFTCKTSSSQKVTGFINVFFNEGAQKRINQTVINSKLIKDHSHPLPLNEELKSNSVIQGFYLDNLNVGFPYSVKIYLHYKK